MRGARAEGALDAPGSFAYPGAVNFVQRFRSNLGLNVHIHLLSLDGVYVTDGPGRAPTFHTAPTLTDIEVARVHDDARQRIEAADAFLEASVADDDDLLVLLAADVASSYVLLRSLQEQIAITDANVESQRDTLDLTRIRFELGAVSELDVSTASATLANTRALLPELHDALRQTTLALCVLLGRAPSELALELGAVGTVPVAPADLAVDIPADLLRRRPDVRRAERIAAAVCAEISHAHDASSCHRRRSRRCARGPTGATSSRPTTRSTPTSACSHDAARLLQPPRTLPATSTRETQP